MEWKKIDGYENYSVSSEGQVRNDKTGRILKAYRMKNGYFRVDLRKKGEVKHFRVHRLVAQAFIENDSPLTKTQVNHINEDKSDNRACNLEWCSTEYNVNYGNRNKKISEAKKGKYTGENNPRCRKIILLNTGEVFDYIKQASEKYGVNSGHICNCCRGKRKSCGKHPVTGEKLVWQYYDEYLESLK